MVVISEPGALHPSFQLPAGDAVQKACVDPASTMPGAWPMSISRCPGRPWNIGLADARCRTRHTACTPGSQVTPAIAGWQPWEELSDGAGGIICRC